MKTLYVSDLDGTLLRRDKTVSEFTVNTINELTKRGMLFSYATARSYVSAGRMTAGITAHIPVIIYNGAFILENGTRRKMLFEHMPHADAHRVLDILLAHDIYPIVYAMVCPIILKIKHYWGLCPFFRKAPGAIPKYCLKALEKQ